MLVWHIFSYFYKINSFFNKTSMKKLTYLIVILIFSFTNFKVFSQEDLNNLSSNRFPEIFEKDNTLKLLSRFISENWKISQNEDTLIFTNITDVYKLDRSKLNDTVKITRKTIKTQENIVYEKVSIYFLIEELWTNEKVNEVFLKNNFTKSRIENLKNRAGIEELSLKIDLDNYETDLKNLNQTEKNIALRYFEDKIKLEEELIQTPDYNTSTVSLFIKKITPKQNEHDQYSPPGILLEIKELLALFDKYVGK